MIYRRDIAKEVFGSDDPAEVQKKLQTGIHLRQQLKS